MCKVYILNIQNENLQNLREIRLAQESMKDFLNRFKNDSEKFQGDMLSDESIQYFYRKLFSDATKSSEFDFPVKKLNTSIFEMLSGNRDFLHNRSKETELVALHQAFKTAGQEFHVFEDMTEDVIVPYDEKARRLIADLYSEKAKYDMGYMKKKLDALQPYTVSLYQYQIEQLVRDGGLHMNQAVWGKESPPFYTILEMYYNPKTGFHIEGYLND